MFIKIQQVNLRHYGNQVQIRDDETGLYYRYCHMLYGSITVNLGDRVEIGSRIGTMGNTGNSTGTHLHLECTRTKAWQCNSFIDPRKLYRNTKYTRDSC